MLTISLSLKVHIIELLSLCLEFVEGFYHEMSLFLIYWDDHMIFILQSADKVYCFSVFMYSIILVPLG